MLELGLCFKALQRLLNPNNVFLSLYLRDSSINDSNNNNDDDDDKY